MAFVVVGGEGKGRRKRTSRGRADPKQSPVCLSPSQAAQSLSSDLLGLETEVCKSPLNLNSLKYLSENNPGPRSS